MDKIKSNMMFFIFVGILVVGVIATGTYWYLERSKTMKVKTELEQRRASLEALLETQPNREHLETISVVRDDVKARYDEIRRLLSSWNDYNIEQIDIAGMQATIAEEIGYTDIKESDIRSWIDSKKLNAIEAPNGKYYITREDFNRFLSDIRPGPDIPEELIEKIKGASLYIEETPTTFLGNLQSLQREIIAFSNRKGIVIDAPARNLGFPTEYLVQAKPPGAEANLIELQKQRSAIRDVMYLLLESNVLEIKNISEPTIDTARVSDFYLTKEFEVTFVATYPSIARFLTTLLDPVKTRVEVRNGVFDDFPRNLFIVTDIMYSSDQAETEQKRKQEWDEKKRREEEARRARLTGTPTGTMPRVTDPGATGYIPEMYRTVPRTPGGAPADSEFGKYYEKIRKQEEKTKAMEGRRPEHNILKVTMKISFLDLMGEVTGETTPGTRRTATMGGTAPAVTQ